MPSLEELRAIIAKFEGAKRRGLLVPFAEFLQLPVENQGEIRYETASLLTAIERFEEDLEREKQTSLIPITNVPREELDTYLLEIKPSLALLRRLSSDNPELMAFFDQLIFESDLTQDLGTSRDYIANRLDALILDYLDLQNADNLQLTNLDEDSIDSNAETIALLEKITRFRFFRPGDWLSRLEMVNPMASRRRIDQFPQRIRGRLSEAHECFVLGHYFACIAACRSILEFVLLDRARPTFRFDPYDDTAGMQRPMRLVSLIECVRNVDPGTADDLDYVRDIGNSLVHPPRGRELDQFPPQERIALRVLSIVLELIEKAYP